MFKPFCRRVYVYHSSRSLHCNNLPSTYIESSCVKKKENERVGYYAKLLKGHYDGSLGKGETSTSASSRTGHGTVRRKTSAFLYFTFYAYIVYTYMRLRHGRIG